MSLILDPHLLRHFPEAATLSILDSALAASACALGEEHPAAEALLLDWNQEPPPTLLLGHLLLARIAELRDLLHLYTTAVRRAIGPLDIEPDQDEPF